MSDYHILSCGAILPESLRFDVGHPMIDVLHYRDGAIHRYWLGCAVYVAVTIPLKLLWVPPDYRMP